MTEAARDQQMTTAPSLREQASIERGLAMDAATFSGRSVFSGGNEFNLAVKMAGMMADATILPEAYRGNASNCLIAVDYAARLHVSPIQMAQNMDVVKGRPGLRGTFLIGLINASPLFSRLKFEWRGKAGTDGKEPSSDYGCRAYATEVETGDVLYGTWVDWAMVKGEGWNRNDKWTTLREQMFMYRAAAFWSRTHASDITLGLHESGELDDSEPQRANIRVIDAKPRDTQDDFERRIAARAETASERRLAADKAAAVDADQSDTTVSDSGAGEDSPPAPAPVDPAPESPSPTSGRRPRRTIE